MRPPITAGPMVRAANGLSVAAEGVGRDGAVSRAAAAGRGAGLLCGVTDAETRMTSTATAATQCMNEPRGLSGPIEEPNGGSRACPANSLVRGAPLVAPSVGAQHDAEQIRVREIPAHTERAGALRRGHHRLAGMRRIERDVRQPERLD